MKDITVAVIGNSKFNDRALERTLSVIDCKKVLTFTTEVIHPTATHIPVKDNFSRSDFNLFCLKNLWPFIDTEHVLLVHYDAIAVNKDFWTDDFLKYDYIGAPWPGDYSWIKPEERVGNGGFSLRSKKLLEALKDFEIKSSEGNDRTENEDAVICQTYRQFLKENYKINFAPIDVAHKFSQELCNMQGKTFGFHGLWNMPYYFNEDEIILYLNEIKKDYWSQDRIDIFLNYCAMTGCHKVLKFINENFV